MTNQAQWTHKVVKMQRGGDSKWFAHKTAGTFASFDEAMVYAESFAAEQRAAGVTTTRVTVIARKGGATVANFNVNRADVVADLANKTTVYA